jgi:hypothetical protein
MAVQQPGGAGDTFVDRPALMHGGDCDLLKDNALPHRYLESVAALVSLSHS